ncbi:CD209 antigen-like protein E [Protopterus annectens]|uniref:CD209 antigen-like protein E n=1 Tax=Protopterus annectens TaxID=7888 RepID=UPI001CFAE857|nr:CD209 antigen-like protein E [Protopterus annectens]
MEENDKNEAFYYNHENIYCNSVVQQSKKTEGEKMQTIAEVTLDSHKTYKKTTASRRILYIVMCIIFLLIISIVMTVLYLQQSKQLKQSNQAIVLLNSSFQIKLIQSKEELKNMTCDQTSLQLQLKQAELKITNLIESQTYLQTQLRKAQQNITEFTRRMQVECCEPQWELFRFHCYYFFEDSKDWFAAQTYCKHLSADLVVIKSKEEQEFIKLEQTIHGGIYWIGMTDNETEGTWRWVDGTPCNSSSGNPVYWDSNQPNNNGDEDCAIMYPDGTWHDYSCSDTFRVICEKTAYTCYFKG